MINPTNCSPFTVASQGIGDQGTAADFSSYFQAVNCATLPFKPKMTISQLGGRKATTRGQESPAALRSDDPPRRRQHQIARRHPAERLRDRPAPPRQHLLRERTGRKPVRRPPADRHGDNDDAAARTAALGPGLRGLGLRRPAAPRLHPRRPGHPRAPGPKPRRSQGGRHCRRPSRSSPTPRSATSGSPSSAASRATWSTPAISAPTPVTKVEYIGQNGKTRTQKIKLKAPCSKRRASTKRDHR